MNPPDLSAYDGRHALTFVREFRHSPETVWRAITDPQHLSAWYPFHLKSIDPVPGGYMEFDDGAGGVMSATVVAWEPVARFAFSEHAPDAMPRESDDLVSFELTLTESGCRLIFIHVFDDRQAAASYATGWEDCLDALAQTLDGREPAWGDRQLERYESHHARMELDRGIMRGDSLMFDRQLMRQSRAKAWEIAVRDARPGGTVPPGMSVASSSTGVITELAPETALTVTYSDGTTANWSFGDGPGGARLGLEVTPAGDEPEWRNLVEGLVRRIIAANDD